MTKDYDALRAERLDQVSKKYRKQIARTPNAKDVGVKAMRAGMKMAMMTVRRAKGVSVRDIEIPGPAGPIPTRIFTPDGVEGPLGVAVNLHFGGFVAGGGISTFDGAHSTLALAVGCAVVAPDFRLPPEHPFPAGIEDVWAVTNWVADNAAEQGWDNSRIAIGGGCSGGNLASVIALMARDAGAPTLALQYPWSFPTDAHCDTESQREFAEGYGLEAADNQFLISKYMGENGSKDDWRVSPLLVPSVEGVAPAVMVVGEWDILRDEVVQYARRFEEAGVPVSLHIIPLEGHFPNPDNDNAGETVLHKALSDRIGSTR
ncbi:alpha/beta hydrolase [Umezawaea endophytica]|uniref:Alpha/beta hydrolase n=1 Tax=Umezawaea endophytica TaxID=1654476 RepID=A0A9X2VPS9_9PSEU|nr:alpha/beta hydrolase [Umezawaea endophytica]MCS7480455.1 alpha/beta hydrolase [Umezawaea endophytica]